MARSIIACATVILLAVISVSGLPYWGPSGTRAHKYWIQMQSRPYPKARDCPRTICGCEPFPCLKSRMLGFSDEMMEPVLSGRSQIVPCWLHEFKHSPLCRRYRARSYTIPCHLPYFQRMKNCDPNKIYY